MKKGAVIIDDRPSTELSTTIQKHMDFLPGWNLKHIKDVPIKNAHDYNKLLTDYQFWNDLKYDKVLIFQHDSLILREGIEEFLEYDYIGAPIEAIRNFHFPAMNGGLSLRTPKVMMDCIYQRPINKTNYRYHNEDIYYSYTVGEVGGKLPDYETARKFSVETIFGLGSFGIHAASKYLSNNELNQILTQYEQG